MALIIIFNHYESKFCTLFDSIIFFQVSLKIDESEVDHALQDKILLSGILSEGIPVWALQASLYKLRLISLQANLISAFAEIAAS